MGLRLGVLLSIFTSVTWAFVPRALDLRKLEREFYQDNQFVQNRWEGSESWEGTFCNGESWYTALVQAEVDQENLTFEITDRGTVMLAVALNRPYARVEAKYRSGYSLCVPVEGWLGVGAGRLTTKAEMTFLENEEGQVRVNVEMRELQFDKIEVGPVPEWLESRLTRIVNSAFRAAWTTRIGEWANRRLSEEINAVMGEHIDGAN